MPHFVESTLSDACLYIRHEIDPKSNLCTIQWRLLDDTLGTISHIIHDDIISLISGIAKEIAFEYGAGSLQFTTEQLIICAENSLHLLIEGQA